MTRHKPKPPKAGKVTKLKGVWIRAQTIIWRLGVYRILPDVRDTVLEWASTRDMPPENLAYRYLLELADLALDAKGNPQ